MWEISLVFKVLMTNYLLKVLTEVVLTPFTYWVVGFLKRAEQEDFFDHGTNFSPLPGRD